MPDGSYPVSDIQDYIEYIFKKHETLTTIPPIHVLKKQTSWPLFMSGVQLAPGWSHFEEAVYFLPLSSQKFWVLILPNINRINNRLVFKIKDEYNLELQTPETMKLFGSTKKLIDKIKNGENVPCLRVAKVVLVQCNLVDNQYQ